MRINEEHAVVKRIIVIGGGASGMVAAIHAKEEKNQVLILEKNDRIGKKILATGNGKCNLGNLFLEESCYYCEDKERLRNILEKYGTEDSVAFFEALGLMVREKNGYLYPYCEQAAAVLDVLRMELARRGVDIQCGVQIVSCIYQKEKNIFRLQDLNGNTYTGDRVIVACGGPASLKNSGMDGYRIAKSFGIKMRELVPGLVQLRTGEKQQKEIAGVRCQAALTLCLDGKEVRKERGELQFTEYGISGIPVFQMSRIAAYGIRDCKRVMVKIDFMPEYTEREVETRIRQVWRLRQQNHYEDFQTGLLHKKLNLFFLHKCGWKPGETLGNVCEHSIQKLLHYYKGYEVPIVGTNPFFNAQICAGGIALEELNENFEAKKQEGLYFTGELIDVDGICGGYNLHWAFATGTIAGCAAKGREWHAENS